MTDQDRLNAIHAELQQLRHEMKALTEHIHIGNGRPGLSTRVATCEQSIKLITWLAGSATVAALSAIAQDVIK